MNIRAFTCNFACKMTTTCFQSYHLQLPDCNSMRFINFMNYHLIGWWWNVNVTFRLLDDLIVNFVAAFLTQEINGYELAWTINLVLQKNQLTKCAKVEIKILAVLKTSKARWSLNFYWNFSCHKLVVFLVTFDVITALNRGRSTPKERRYLTMVFFSSDHLDH